jgi:hypothetical protein
MSGYGTIRGDSNVDTFIWIARVAEVFKAQLLLLYSVSFHDRMW